MSEGNKLRNILLYYLLSSIRELGISLPLLFRRVTETASKDVEYISKTFFGGNLQQVSLEQIFQDLAEMLKKEGLAEKIEVKMGDSHMEMKVYNCRYLDMAKKGKEKGEEGCPICLMSIAASLAATLAKGISFNSVEYSSDTDNNVCDLRINFMKEE